MAANPMTQFEVYRISLLYTTDASDDMSGV